MDFIWDSITDWLKEVLVSGIVSNLSGMFDSTNAHIGEIAGQVGLTPQAWNSGIFIVIYGRMIEVYLVTSVAPIPMATMANREWGQMGQNYLRTLFALGFQAFLIMVCVAISSVLVQSISVSGDISNAIWTCMGYTVLLCFCLFKTSSLARSVFNAH